MLRNKPRLTYNGLTIVLSNPSRFDKTSLLSANGGGLVDTSLRPEFNLYQCDVRLKEDRTPLLNGTKLILLLGDDTHKTWVPNNQTHDNSISEIRGSLFKSEDGLPIICSYFPQDCVDIKDYETQSKKNAEVEYQSEEDDEDADPMDDKSRHNKTKRKNFAFWFQKDLERVRYLLKDEKIPSYFEPEYIISPSSKFIIDTLTSTKNKKLFIDIETDENLNIKCFSFSFGSNPIVVVPCLSHFYSWSYDNLPLIYRALAIAFRNNCVVAHNGAGFDFFVFAHKYRIPIGRDVYDTMIAHHRCFPEVEKSLGHCTSLWTWEPFHKDEGNVGYYTMEQARQLWKYCGKDVYTMILIHDAIELYASKRPGLKDSINQANSSIRPYLITSLQGIKYDNLILEDTFKENDRLMMQYNRIINLLVGPDSIKKIRGKSVKPMAGSNKQCCVYFHEMLGYPVVGRGKERKDGTKGPSLAKKNMLKLKLKHNNPVIDFCIAYRELAKESGSLKFTPWKE